MVEQVMGGNSILRLALASIASTGCDAVGALLETAAETPADPAVEESGETPATPDGPAIARAEPGPPTFERKYGGLWMDAAFAVSAVADGGYVLTGNSEKVDNRHKGDYDVLVVRTKPDGERMWSARSGALDQSDTGFGVVARPDGGAVVVGLTGSKGARRIIALRLDPTGEFVWEKTYDDQGVAKATAIAAMPDGRYVVTGWVAPSSVDKDLAVWSLDDDGALSRISTHGGEGQDVGYAVVASDEGFAVAGVTNSSGAGQNDAWVLRFAGGTVRWEKTYGGRRQDASYAIARDGDGYVVAGDQDGAGWVAWLDHDGNVREEQRVTTGKAFRALARADGVTVAAGETRRKGMRDAWLVGFDADRTSTVDRIFGYNRRVVSGAVTSIDGGFALAGNWHTTGSNYSNFWLCKVDAALSGCSEK